MSQCRCKEEIDDEGTCPVSEVDAEDSDGLLNPDRDYERILASLRLTKEVEDSLRAVDAPVAIVFMRQGSFLTKFPKAAKLHRRGQARMFKADMDNLTLRWLSPRRPESKTYLPMTTVDRIVPGTRSSFFKEHERELGIEIISTRRKLRVVCPTIVEWRLWMRGLTYMLEKAEAKRRRGLAFQKADFIRTLWDIGDTDKSGSLLLEEVVQLAKKLQVQLDSRYIALIFHTLDQDKTNVLDYVQFRELVRMLIYSPECNKMFLIYCASKDLIKSDGIKSFLLDIQKEKEPSAELQLKLLNSLELFGLPKESGTLNEFHWCRLMLSEWNTILDESKLAHCHDMSQPLSQFWISSSDDPFSIPRSRWAHQTDDPLRCLIILLMRGVRFLRVRLIPHKEGDEVAVDRAYNDKPGGGACPSVDFHAFISTVKQSAFLTSLYPVILHFEFINCTWAHRLWAAKTTQTICGDSLLLPCPDSLKPPSVESMMKKILICAPVLMEATQIAWSGTEVDASMRYDLLVDPLAALKIPPIPITQSYRADMWKELNEVKVTEAERTAALRDMQKLVAIRARSMATDVGRLRTPMEMYSVSADQLVSLRPPPPGKSNTLQSLKSETTRTNTERSERPNEVAQTICNLNTRTLCHCFVAGPPGYRVNRSFTLAMAMGVHCISIPHSSDGMAVILQQALFWQNGTCGYVAKPRILSNPSFDPFRADRCQDFSDAPQEVRVSVLEGRQIPRGPMPLIGGAERLCPYVVVSVRGLPSDNASQVTRPVINNGFAPRWDAPEYVFKVTVPSLSFLCFEVRHYDSPMDNMYLAGAAFVLSTIRQGLRWVPLRDQFARRVPWSGLLVKVAVRPLKSEQPSRPHTAGYALPGKVKLESPTKEGLKRLKS